MSFLFCVPAADPHRHAKLCPSHNLNPHGCIHQHPHTCQRPMPLASQHCEMHPCIHKPHIQHICRSGPGQDWPDGVTTVAGGGVPRGRPVGVSVSNETPRSARNRFGRTTSVDMNNTAAFSPRAPASDGSPQSRSLRSHRHSVMLPPSVNVLDDFTGKREHHSTDAISHLSGEPTVSET